VFLPLGINAMQYGFVRTVVATSPFLGPISFFLITIVSFAYTIVSILISYPPEFF
jgi:hypothetical protein